MTNHKTITTTVTYLNELPQSKLQYISQLEMLYKACAYTLNNEGIEVPEQHEKLLGATPDYDTVNLLDTLDILHDLIINHDNYSELKRHNDIIDFAKSKVITVDSLDALEQQLDLSEREVEMAYEFYLDDTLELVLEHTMNENSIDTLDELEQAIETTTLEFYYAEHDRKFVAVFS